MPDAKSKTKRTTKKKDKRQAGPSAISSRAELLEAARKLEEEAHQDRVDHPLRFGAVSSAPEQHLGERLQEARRFLGLTQQQLAQGTARADQDGRGISSAVISLYERGKNNPGPKELRLLCEVLRVSPNRLLYGDEDPFGSFTERDRYASWTSSNPEFLAYLTYCFSRLHHHHARALLDLMMAILRGWNRDFDAELHANAIQTFMEVANDLRKLLEEREQQKQKPD